MSRTDVQNQALGTLYRWALDHGFANTLQAILQMAEQDGQLEQIIHDIHRSMRTPEDEASFPAAIAFMAAFLQHLKSQ